MLLPVGSNAVASALILPQRLPWLTIERKPLGPRTEINVIVHSLNDDPQHPQSGHIRSIAQAREAFQKGANRVDVDTHTNFFHEAVLEHDVVTQIGMPSEALPGGALQLLGHEPLEPLYESVGDGQQIYFDIKYVAGGYGNPRRTMFAIKRMLDRDDSRRTKSALTIDNERDINEFAQLEPTVEVGLSWKHPPSTFADVKRLYRQALHCGASSVEFPVSAAYNRVEEVRNLVTQAAEKGVVTGAWNIKSRDDGEFAVSLGARKITVDNYRLGRDVANRFEATLTR